MGKFALFAAAAAAMTLVGSPALAGTSDGRWQVKLLGTGVLPDGRITQVKTNTIGLPAGSQTKANDNVVPTLAIEYYLSPALSVETICCLTQHHIDGAGAISGTRIVDHVLILPATATLKYHLDTGMGFAPYVGAGPSLFLYFDEKPGATTRALGGTSLNLSNRVGAVLQAGVDIPINARGMGVSFDAKRYFMRTTLHVRNAAGAEVLQTDHKLDPWVLSGGLYYRF